MLVYLHQKSKLLLSRFRGWRESEMLLCGFFVFQASIYFAFFADEQTDSAKLAVYLVVRAFLSTILKTGF